MSQRKNYLIAPLLFLISFGVYLKTLCPTVYVGDSGEFIAACYTLGIPHPPGSPLYCLLGRLFTLLPFGSVAYRVNLMSAFFASLTVVLIYFIVLKIQDPGSRILDNHPTIRPSDHKTIRPSDHPTIRPYDHKTNMLSPLIFNHISAISAALLFAFSLTLWSQAVIAEVYTLNTFFIALLIYILLKWKETFNYQRATGDQRRATCNRYLYLFALGYGVSLTNHQMMLLFAPAYLLYILWNKPQIAKEGRTLFNMLLLFLLGLLIYLYLPLRSLTNPPIDWGNPENLSNFLAHITRTQFRGLEFELKVTPWVRLQFVGNFLRELSRQFTPFIGWLGIAGLLCLGKEKKFRISTALIFLLNGIGLILLLHFPYSPKNIYRVNVYYIPAYLVFVLWMGYGTGYLLKKGAELNSRINAGGRGIYLCLASLLIFSLFFLPLSRNYFPNDRSQYYLAHDYALNILKDLDEGAILVAFGGRKVFPLAYLHMAEGMRPDITIYDGEGNVLEDMYQGPKNRTQENWRDKRNIIERKLIAKGQRPVYYTFDRDMREIPGYLLKPLGLIYKVEREGIEPGEERNWEKDYQMRGIDDEKVFKDYATRILTREYHYLLGNYYSQGGNKKEALEHYFRAGRIGWEMKGGHLGLGLAYQREGMIDWAILEYERAIEFNERLVRAYSNLGICYALKGRYQEAREEWEKALKLYPEYEEVRENLRRLGEAGNRL